MFSEGARDSAEDLIGALVDGRYKVLEAMAAGSMGAVFKAERVPVGKLVAIKFLHSSFANDAEFLARFERETRVMSKLAHPNCVSVVDFGVWQGAPYLVMEFVAGRTLRAILDDEGALQPTRALAIARQLAAGLAHAHAQEIVHRDIKPANIMISEELGHGEHVRILDFGLARLRGAVGRDATQTNVVVGTPNYMAPEQTIGGGTIDARTDVYALGVVLFEMIAGVRPFQADDTLALLGMHRAAPIPKLADRVEDTVVIPLGLQEAIEKAMAKSPDDRYQSAIELAAAIDALAPRATAGTGPAQIVVSPTRRTDTVSVAPTMVDITSERRTAPARRRTSRIPVLLVLLVLGGGAYAAYYLKTKKERAGRDAAGSGEVATAGSAGALASLTPDAAAATDEPAVPDTRGQVLPADAAAPAITPDAPAVDDVAAAGSGSGGTAPTIVDGSGSGSAAATDDDDGAGSGSAAPGEIDMAPDPLAAADPKPEDPSKPVAEDEADDAPKTTADVEQLEKRAPPAPVKATTIHDAVVLIKDGKDELALASLRSIWKKTPNSAYVPFLLGNLYFDKTWWSVAMDHYRIAITKNAGYKRNATLNRNIIRMLGSAKTNKKAQYFLKKTIGKVSLPYLRHAAKHEKSPHTRKWAAYLARTMR